jgi:multicomponent Na+:H+ antiporter subunit C
MSVLIAMVIGFLVTVAVLQILQRDIVRILIGLYFLWNAANLLFLAAARIRGVAAPFADGTALVLADPLVQAVVLTAIIITFGFAAFLVLLVVWLARAERTLDLDNFRDVRD